jgi:3'(2'), 5'-bisphosphate nucleotidase
MFAGEPGRALAARYDIAANPLTAPAPISAQTTAPAQWRIVASDHSGRNERTQNFIAALGGVAAHASSSIKFCRLAEGAADLYPRFGEVSEWDAAAGHAILSAAGGGVVRLDGSPVRYGDRDGGFLIRGFLAYASERAREAAYGALRN